MKNIVRVGFIGCYEKYCAGMGSDDAPIAPLDQ